MRQRLRLDFIVCFLCRESLVKIFPREFFDLFRSYHRFILLDPQSFICLVAWFE